MKRVIVLLLFLFQFILISTVLAQTPAITNGLSYLNSTQNPDGSWTGMINRGMLPTTMAVIETLSILGQGNSQNYINAASWLRAQQIPDMTTSDYLAERIHVLSGAGSDESLLLSYLDAITGAWGGDGSPDVDNLDTALALQALKAVNYPDQNVISSALYYLTSTQNPDGGWGFDQGDDSNVFMTATVLNTLSQFKSTYNLQTPINKATAYLLTKQNPDGGFGSSPSTVYETSLAFEALIASGAVGADKAANIQNAVHYLTFTQLPNGSWNDDPYSTARKVKRS